ncbi:fungal-specific transcription factor domain-containing protein, partial [Amylocarpus encephaloides]
MSSGSVSDRPAKRPAKRILQACGPCRRKKVRCPGEKPICSLCLRLNQPCVFADQEIIEREIMRVSSPSQSPLPKETRPPTNDKRLEDRLKNVESQLAEVLANRASHASPSRQTPASPATSYHARLDLVQAQSNNSLPSWEIVEAIAETYLLYCDCQPLPLFHKSSFQVSLRERDPEVLLAILALASRFSDLRTLEDGRRAEVAASWAGEARAIISKRVFDGNVEFSTIQSLCLLTLVDFTNGNKRRASMHSSLAMCLAHNSGLTCETHAAIPFHQKEERRRCFWSLFLLKRLHGADFMVLDFPAEANFPWYPETTGIVPDRDHHTGDHNSSAGTDSSTDKGIVAYAIQMSEVWFKITRYAWRRGIPSDLPPWSPQSEYSAVLAQQMDFETRMPYIHRFNPAKFSQRPLEELNATRDYWGPWLLIQFLYHTNLCLLNHPLLISLRLWNFKGVIPEIFLQNTADLMTTHTSWIINFIDMLEAKEFVVTDPFLAHCVAIVATIYLQESFLGDLSKRREKKESFEKCLKFIRGFGRSWPHVGRIASKLSSLSETVSSTHDATLEPIRQNRKLLIDLGQFFEILEYSSSSELPGSDRQLFGSSLSSTFRASRTEMAQTTVLPEPTRLERQEFGTSASSTPMSVNLQGNDYSGGGMGFNVTPDASNEAAFQFSDDELAVLAENFFQVRQDGGDGGGGNWWNMG